MTTLMIVVDGSGKVVGRCDERCYNALHSRCKCICAGANHGKGLKKAIANTRAEPKKMIETYLTENNIIGGSGIVDNQIEFFE